MKHIFTTYWRGIRKSIGSWQYGMLFVFVFVLFAALFVLIPVFLQDIAGDIGYAVRLVLDVFRFWDYVIIFSLSLLYALFITMRMYVMRQKMRVKNVGAAVGGGVGTLFAGIVGTAFCPSCLASLLGFLGIGFGGTVFALEYRFYFVVGISAVMLCAIYYIARKIHSCDACNIHE